MTGKLNTRRRADRWAPRPLVAVTGAFGGMRSRARAAPRSCSETGAGPSSPDQSGPREMAPAGDAGGPENRSHNEERDDRRGVVQLDRRLRLGSRQQVRGELR